MKAFLEKITDRTTSHRENAESTEQEQGQPEDEVAGEVDHLWMKEDLDAKKPKLEKDPRVDTGILRNRIADKLAKMNNH